MIYTINIEEITVTIQQNLTVVSFTLIALSSYLGKNK